MSGCSGVSRPTNPAAGQCGRIRAIAVRARDGTPTCVLGGPGHATSLGPVREALLGAANPKSVLTWLGRSNSARILAALARHDGPFTTSGSMRI